MYYCENCATTFDSPDHVKDFDSEAWGVTVHHYTSVCPDCGSEDITEAVRCRMCGGWGADTLCETCSAWLNDYARTLRQKILTDTMEISLNYEEALEELKERL